MRSGRRMSIAVFLVGAGTLAAAVPAFADDPPLPPPRPPGYPPPGLLVPGSSGPPYGLQNGLLPILPGTANSPVDAGGVGVGTNADQTTSGMPGSRLGTMPTRAGPFGPAPGVRVSAGGVGVSTDSAGVSVSTSGDIPTEPTTAVPFPAVTPGQAPN
jgi:hypothetical protein